MLSRSTYPVPLINPLIKTNLESQINNNFELPTNLPNIIYPSKGLFYITSEVISAGANFSIFPTKLIHTTLKKLRSCQ